MHLLRDFTNKRESNAKVQYGALIAKGGGDSAPNDMHLNRHYLGIKVMTPHERQIPRTQLLQPNTHWRYK